MKPEIKHLIEYHTKKLMEARHDNNKSAIAHHEAALRYLKKHGGGGNA